ncbi:hypothetical protein LXL04_034585 [Taraxacum kok-saghyz]
MKTELTKMDFNIVQAIHVEDLKHSSRYNSFPLTIYDMNRWWRNTSWDKDLSFVRDRLVENFMWTIGINYLPHLKERC